MRVAALSLSVACLWACGDADPLEPPDASIDASLGDASSADAGATDAEPVDSTTLDADVVDAAPSLSLTFTSCPSLAGDPDPRPECATVDVPLAWGDGEASPRISLFVKRVPAMIPSGKKLWVLLGGPGQAGAGGESLARALSSEDPTLDIYLPDHRGTGSSTPLRCPVQQAASSPSGATIAQQEWPACRDAVVAEWGLGLSHFSSTEAALDVRALIDAEHHAGDRDFVLGVSYGTYLANRYLQVAPDQAAGVVMDSICGAESCWLSEIDVRENEVTKQIFERCAQDADCAAHLGPDPWATFGDLYDRVLTGHCHTGLYPASATIQTIRTTAGVMAFSASLRRALPAFVYRMARCNAADRTAVANLQQLLFSGTTHNGWSSTLGFSYLLSANILAGELWAPTNPDSADLAARWDQTYACRGAARQAGWQTEGWPRYHDPLAGAYAETSIPLLLMNAELDTATPVEFARPYGQHYTGPHQHYVEIPGSSHGVLFQGPLRDQPTMTCGRLLFHQFTDDPEAPLDTSCLTRTTTLAFALSSTGARTLFGTNNLWGD